MDIWIGGEVDEVIYSIFREARGPLQEMIRAEYARKAYGKSLKQVVVIPIIMADNSGFLEIRKYHKRDKSLELRIQIPYGNFASGNQAERQKMLLAILNEVVPLSEHNCLPSFDSSKFTQSLNKVRNTIENQ